MMLDRITRRRAHAARAATLLFILCLVAIVDGFAVRFREPENALRLLAGESAKVNGTVPGTVQKVDELAYRSTSEAVRLTIDTMHTGFWLGGQMWRGVVRVGPEVAPGEYSLSVFLKGQEDQKPTSVFQIGVYKDQESYRQGSKSFLFRSLGVPPWHLFAVCLVLLGAFLGLVFYFSHQREGLLAEQGMAEIYYVKKVEGGFEIGFALGTLYGVQVGSRLDVLDDNGHPVTTVEVQTASGTDAKGTIGPEHPIKHGYLVRRL
ncbi:MAG: hypothetical protein ACLGPL_05280 [Acidobacteriota bacterium]